MSKTSPQFKEQSFGIDFIYNNTPKFIPFKLSRLLTSVRVVKSETLDPSF